MKDWFQRVCLQANFIPDGAQRQDVAEFWLNAFVNEVEKRAKDVISCDPDEQTATAFDKLKNELGL